MSDQIALHWLLECANVIAISTLILAAAWVVNRSLALSASMRHSVWVMALSVTLLLPVFLACIPSRVAAFAVLGRGTELGAIKSTQLLFHSGFSVSFVRHIHWSRWLEHVGILWVAGTTIFSSQLVVALWVLRSAYRRSEPSFRDCANVNTLAAELGVRKSWRLRVSKVDTPATAMTWGMNPPVVLLPLDSHRWSNERFKATVLHELAHVCRCDSMISFVGFLCCALFWFNPLVWLCARKLRFEAEAAADDFVLSAGIRASDYAAVLLGSISGNFKGRTPALPAISRMEPFGIEKRICALLDVSANRAKTTRAWIVQAVLLSAFLAIGLCALRPAFANTQSKPEWRSTAPTKPADLDTTFGGAKGPSSSSRGGRDIKARSADRKPLTSPSLPSIDDHPTKPSADSVGTPNVSDTHPGVSADGLPEGPRPSLLPDPKKSPDARPDNST